MRNRLLTIVLLAATALTASAQNHRLWYAQPAKHWLEALPVGNSHMGAMIYGGTETEEIQLNEETFWSGQPHNNNSSESLEYLSEVRRLIFQGKENEASKLIDQHFVKGPHGMRFLPLGSVKLKLGHKDVTNYRRELSLGDALATTSYVYNGVKYDRTVFASQADSVIVIHIEASKRKALAFEMYFDSQLKYETDAVLGTMVPGPPEQDLWATVHGVDQEGINAGLTAECHFHVESDGWLTAYDTKSISLKNASWATIIISAATNFVNYHDVSGDPRKKNNARIAAVRGKSYKSLLASHIKKYQEQYNRVALNLPKSANSGLETDKRVAAFEKDATDLDLVGLMMQYGRYLLISSSQPGGQAANLQGMWNDNFNAPWDSKYTININAEMNYWPALIGNIAETQEPLFSMVKDLSETGAITAKQMYGCRGWMAHHNTDIWRIAGPVDGTPWGMFPTGGAWLTTHIWQHYLYTGDKQFLATYYPVLKGAAQFLMDYMQVYPSNGEVKQAAGWLVTVPTVSPEHGPMGKGTNVTAGSTMDNQIAFDVLSQALKAAKVLGNDEAFVEESVSSEVSASEDSSTDLNSEYYMNKPFDNPEAGRAPAIPGNGKHFVKFDGKIYFRIPGKYAMKEAALWGDYDCVMADNSCTIAYLDKDTNEIVSLFEDSSYGPITISGGRFILSESKDGEELPVQSVSLDGYSIEISNDQKELLLMNDTDLPWIDLFTCGEKLRAYFRNNSNEPLIIIKYGKISELTYEQELEFEVYDPDTFVKLNLSICNESDINLIINLPLSDELVKALKNIIDQGYDPFDISDKFYREICTPYDSENGTDVLLDAREEYYYSSLNNIVCPDHCHTSSYDLESKYLKCECPVNDTDITLNLKHITGENIGNSFYSTLKNSNWKVMICYNLVFNWEMFKKNKGSIISLIFFIIYLGFIIYFILRGIQPLQVAISKIMFVEMKPELQIDQKDENGNDNSTNANNKLKLKKKKNKKVKIKNNPPKKENSRKINDGIIIVKDSDNTKISSFSDSKKLKSGEKLMTAPNKSKNASFKNKFKKELIYTEGANLKKQEELTKEKEEQMLNLDNFQLNNLEYPDACKYDKRPFLTTYYSVLMREHIILFTFFSWKDYNLFYIKIERFLVLICTQMAMNGLFFSDESMHKANKSDNYNFVQQLPKIIFSLIATHLIEVALCYFSMTDTVYYRIKELAKYKNNDEKIIDEINCMKRKIIAFYVITFLLFLFYWYFISAFCVVYQNTQKTFLLDSLISIIVQFIDPFFIYCFTTLLRYLSLAKCAKNNMECVYKTSYLIPIF